MKYYSIGEFAEKIGKTVQVFSCRLQGKRANTAKKMIKELLHDAKDIKSNADS